MGDFSNRAQTATAYERRKRAALIQPSPFSFLPIRFFWHARSSFVIPKRMETFAWIGNLKRRVARLDSAGEAWQDGMPTGNAKQLQLRTYIWNVVPLTKRRRNSWQRVKECGKNTGIFLDRIEMGKRRGDGREIRNAIKRRLFVNRRESRRKEKRRKMRNISGNTSNTLVPR